jgi:hypothetical protein
VVQGRKNVIDSLVCLGPYMLSYDDSRRPFYDVAILTVASPAGSMSRDLVLLTIHGDAVHVNAETGNDHALSVDQTFLLCRPEDLEDWEKVDDGGGSIWGCVVPSGAQHEADIGTQISFFETSWRERRGPRTMASPCTFPPDGG